MHGQVLAADVWLPAIAQHSFVWAVPHRCALDDEDTGKASRELQRISAMVQVPVAPVAITRLDVDCDQPPPAVPLDSGELRIVWNTIDDSYTLAGAHCVDFGLGVACTELGSRSEFVDSLVGSTASGD